jgi:CubicO group peptidase (beta-lactamase class C family)
MPITSKLGLGFVALFALSVPPMTMAAPASASANAIDAVVRKAHDAGQFDGVVVAARGDEAVYRRAIGKADRITEQAHAPGEIWRWGSLTHQVTAVLVMQEVERGRLRLDGALGEYLPGFGGVAVARVTLRQLLLHTAGLANPDDTPADSKGVPAFYRGEGEAAATKSAPRVCAEAPKRAPGDHFENNICDDLVLGAILERVNDASYAQLVAKRIVKPLGLRSLGVLRASTGSAGSIVGYTSEGVREPAINAGRLGAAGALYGSSDDLLRFDRALIGDTLVSAATASAMREGNPKLGYIALGALAYTAELKHCDEPIMLVERDGEIGGVRAVNVIAPAQRTAVIAFSNTGRTDWGLVWQGSGLLYDLLDAALCTAPSAPVAAIPRKKGARR